MFFYLCWFDSADSVGNLAMLDRDVTLGTVAARRFAPVGYAAPGQGPGARRMKFPFQKNPNQGSPERNPPPTHSTPDVRRAATVLP